MNLCRNIFRATFTLAIMPALPPVAVAQTPASQQSSDAALPTMPPIDRPLPYGMQNIGLPGGTPSNGTRPRTVELLAAELARPGVPSYRRADMVVDLASTKLPSARTAVISAAGDADPIVRATVAAALGEMADPSRPSAGAGDAIARLAVDSDATVRATAVRSAAVLGRADLVTAGLNDADPTVVTAALSVAGADAGAAIIAKLTGTDVAVVVLATEAAARNNLTTTADAIASNLRKEGAPVPLLVASLRALGTLKATAQGAAVVEFLAHAHPSVRREATVALSGVLPADDARRRGISMLTTDADESVRAGAATMLGRVPGVEVVAPLTKALSDPYAPLHDAARGSLVATGAPAVSAAVALLDDAEARRREDGSYILGALASREGYGRHVALLKDADWKLVQQVADSLGKIGGDGATAGPALVEMFNRAIGPDGVTDAKAMPFIGTAAAYALRSGAMLGYAPTGDAGKRIITKKMSMPADARSAAIWAVGVVGCTNPEPVFNSFRGIMADMEDGFHVKFEAVKAVGNLKFKPGMGLLVGGAQTESNPDFVALAHWATDRINGTVTPFTPLAQPWQADTNISDMPQ